MRTITYLTLTLLIVLTKAGCRLLGINTSPPPMENVTATANETGSITITWDALESAAEYGVQLQKHPGQPRNIPKANRVQRITF